MTLLPFPDPESNIERAFWRFHAENPYVYELICRFVDEAIGKGRRKLSMKLLFERIRWYVSIETSGPDFKLNNNFTAYYARLWLHEHPERPGFFETRRRA